MVDIARKLSADFPFVRVDLYDLSGKIVFGELTWIPMGGNCIVDPASFDVELGSWLELPGYFGETGKQQKSWGTNGQPSFCQPSSFEESVYAFVAW